MRPSSTQSARATIGCLLLSLLIPGDLPAQSAAPTPVQREAFDALARSGDWDVRWDEETGSPATISEHRLSVGAAHRSPRPFSPESVTTSFIRRHSGLFPLRPGLDGLVIQQVSSPPRDARRRHGTMHTVRLGQSYRGLLVENGGYAMTMTPDGKVAFINGRFHREIEVDPRPVFGVEDGVRIAMKEVGAGADSVEHPARLLVKRHKARDHLIWEVTVPEDGLHVWAVQVDAHDGRVIFRGNRVIIDPR